MEATTSTTTGWTGRHAVELYVRTYSTMLQSSGEIRLDSLDHVHIGMGSALHPLAAEPRSDMGALIYSVRRLPAVIGALQDEARRLGCNAVIRVRYDRGAQSASATGVAVWIN